jgi:hypothetical protein
MRTLPVALLAAALPFAAACGSRGSMKTGTGGSGPAAGTGGAPAVQSFAVVPTRNQLDLLFVVDDAGAATEQAKLAAQVPSFVQLLESAPGGTPDLHVAVVTSDLGAATNAPLGCSPSGDAGAFQPGPASGGPCGGTPLPAGATYLAQNGALRNFTGDLGSALGCLLRVGGNGCGFIQPLAAAVRALGADGAPAPPGNAGFLRPNAGLGIILLARQDDCSAPPDTRLFSLETDHSSLAEPLGPLTTYRCNRYGHLCKAADGTLTAPPLAAPPGMASASFTDCADADGGPLIPVDQLVQQIRSLKRDPDRQIAVASIVGPTAPYAVTWQPAGMANPQNPNELWPQVLHACGAAGDAAVNPAAPQRTSDGSSGDPAVRLTQFTQAFQNHALSSVCNTSFQNALATVAGSFATPPPVDCIDPAVPPGADGQPACTIVRHQHAQGADQTAVVRNCGSDLGLSPCWTARPDVPGCSAGARARVIQDDTWDAAATVFYDVSCPLCPGAPGCA